MTEEEKEEIYQRALRHRRIFLRVAVAVLIGLLVFLLARCHARPRYSEREIRNILEERYGVDFTLQPLERGIYRAVSDAWPELEGTVRNVWYEGYWDSLLPVWHFPRHAVTDTFQSEAWARYAAPVLAEHGLGDVPVDWESDLDRLSTELAEAIGQIRRAPVFSNLLERGDRIGYDWRVTVTLTAGGDFQVQEAFELEKDWTAEAVREALGKLEGRLERWLEREAEGENDPLETRTKIFLKFYEKKRNFS